MREMLLPLCRGYRGGGMLTEVANGNAVLRAHEPHIVGLCSFICRDVQAEVDAAGTQIKGMEAETALTV